MRICFQSADFAAKKKKNQEKDLELVMTSLSLTSRFVVTKL